MLKDVNKRGQEMSTTTIILLVLGVLILVILILGFTIGWSKFAPFLSKNNVNTIVNSCGTSCSTGDSFAFCFNVKDLNADDVKLKSVTCNYLAQKQAKYGIKECSAISCDVTYVDLKAGEKLQDKCKDTANAGKTIQALVGDTLQSVDCPAASA